MDPIPNVSTAVSSASKEEENAVDEPEKVILAKVLVKCFKVLGVEGVEEKGCGSGTKFVNTKTFKVEDLKEIATEEAISDPKVEISVMRK